MDATQVIIRPVVSEKSYVLAALAPESLARLRFPLGGMRKAEVRELAAAAGNFPLHGRAKIVDVELCDLLRILSGLDVDVPELHGHARLLR